MTVQKNTNPYLSVLLSDEDRKMLDEIVKKKYLNQSDAIRAEELTSTTPSRITR